MMINDRYLFRGKLKSNGKWSVGSVCNVGNSSFIFPDGAMDTDTTKYEIDPNTIGQCTGLRDKNNTLIFEGDICKDSLEWVFEVTWIDDCAKFMGRHSKPRGQTHVCYVDREPPVEVIGNIYDTPELLEAENDSK